MSALPAWADWNPAAAEAPWTVGVEEEVMLLDPHDWSLASRIDDVLPALSP
jgi:carboxylate-amine ligase